MRNASETLVRKRRDATCSAPFDFLEPGLYEQILPLFSMATVTGRERDVRKVKKLAQ